MLIEKLQPIDKRLRYQIEKLQRIASGSILNTETDDVAQADPLNFRPNPKSLLAAQHDSDDEHGSDEEAEEEFSAVAAGKLYKAPKNVPMHYDDLDSTLRRGDG